MSILTTFLKSPRLKQLTCIASGIIISCIPYFGLGVQLGFFSSAIVYMTTFALGVWIARKGISAIYIKCLQQEVRNIDKLLDWWSAISDMKILKNELKAFFKTRGQRASDTLMTDVEYEGFVQPLVKAQQDFLDSVKSRTDAENTHIIKRYKVLMLASIYRMDWVLLRIEAVLKGSGQAISPENVVKMLEGTNKRYREDLLAYNFDSFYNAWKSHYRDPCDNESFNKNHSLYEVRQLYNVTVKHGYYSIYGKEALTHIERESTGSKIFYYGIHSMKNYNMIQRLLAIPSVQKALRAGEGRELILKNGHVSLVS